MKTSIYILVTFLLLTNFANAQQERRTHYLHGLGDDETIWNRYVPFFDGQRRMNPTAHDYEQASTAGIATSEIVLRGIVDNNNPQNYLIGHSMGGLVARQLEMVNDNSINAIITIGTPNEGAFIAANVRNGLAQSLINRAINDLSTGPVSEGKSLITSILTSFGGLSGWIASRWVNKRVDDLAEDLWAQFNEFVEQQQVTLDPALIELSPNNEVLNDLNAHNSNALIANIVLEENDRPGLRLANAFFQAPENAPLNSYNDSDMIRAADIAEAAYKAFRVLNDVKKFTSIFLYQHHNVLANKWHQGEDYIDDKFDADHARAIGAQRTETRTSTYWVEECRCLRMINDDVGPNPGGGCTSGAEICGWVQRTVTSTVNITEKSDGLVTDATQQMATVPNDRRYRAVGAGHLEAGNHPNVTRRFQDVFNRQDELGIQTRQ